MKKIITLFLSLLTFVIMANPVDKQFAEQVAVKQYALNAPSNIADYSVASSFETSYNGIVTFYTFTFKSGGFVIISADDAAIPVLGYSYEGTIALDTYNPIATAWMENYSKAIVEVRTAGMSNAQTLPLWNQIINNQVEKSPLDVPALVLTNWDQGCNYNALCPVESGAGYGSCGHAWTGCVATTMSVLMKYHQWPVVGIGYHTYTHPDYGVQTADFGSANYDYAAMPNSVNTANPAVATLMYHAGVSVNMQYGADGSGAFSEDVPYALCNYFNYAASTHLVAKEDYPVMADWWAIIRAELDAARPVYYAGAGTSGGHAWICDGYKLSDNKFHMNWGWSGSYNGYFAIGSLSAGGSTFNDENRVIVGIEPGNNAATWIVQNTHFTSPSRGIGFVDAVSETVAWASAYNGSGTGGTILNEVCRTSDGGATWVPSQVMGGTVYGIGNICGLDENIAYVALYKGTGNQDNTCGVYKTSNGGLTWTQLPGALQGSASFANNVYFWNEQEGMCHGDVRDGYFEIYTTVNGGTTWQRVPQANITGGVPATGEGGWTSVIETAGDNTVMFGTNKGKVYISDDRGFNWRVTNANITPAANGGINQIAFTDPLNGIVAQTLAPISYRKTTDGGATWTTINPTGPVFKSDLAAVPNSSGIYISTGSDFETPEMGASYSQDGGLTWQLFAGTATKQYLAADMFDSSTGYAGGFNTDADNDGMFRLVGTLGLPAGPQIVTTTSLLGNVPSGEKDTIPFTITNYGSADLEWSIAVEGEPAWLSLSSSAGTTLAGEATDIDVYFDATGILPDTLTSSLIITNNSINNPAITVPVTFSITSGVAVQNISFNDHFVIYPNPTNSLLTIKGDMEIISLSLVNTTGKVMFDAKVNSKEFASSISNLPSGLYILKLTTSKGITATKVSIY